MGGFRGADNSGAGLEQYDVPIAVAAPSCRETVAAGHADLGEHIQETARLLRERKDNG